MNTVHVYIAIEDLGLNPSQRQRVFDAVQTFYQAHQVATDQPHERWHGRFNVDRTQAIFEALFDDAQLSVATFKQLLAAEFDRDPGEIASRRQDTTLAAEPSPFWTFSYNGTDYFRVGVFGGLGASREQSRQEAQQYIQNQPSDWSPTV